MAGLGVLSYLCCIHQPLQHVGHSTHIKLHMVVKLAWQVTRKEWATGACTNICQAHDICRALTFRQSTQCMYGLLNRGEAYLKPTWLTREQRLAQVKINQSITQRT